MNELFSRHLLTAEEYSDVARKKRWEWEDHLNEVLLTKPSKVVQATSQVLEKHGLLVKELKSELYYSSTLCSYCAAIAYTEHTYSDGVCVVE